jgi:hypothetical protein
MNLYECVERPRNNEKLYYVKPFFGIESVLDTAE